MNASDYLEEKLLAHCLNNVPFTSPANIYLALSTAPPTDTGAGLAEPGDTYARQLLPEWKIADVGFGSGDWMGGIEQDVSFPQATTSWGTITHVAVMDALTGGNMLFWVQLAAPVAITKYGVAFFSGDGVKNTLRFQ